MRVLNAFRLVSVLTLGAVSARAAAPIRLVVPELSLPPAACPLIFPREAANITSALSVPPALSQASPVLLRVPSAVDPVDAKAEERYAQFFDGVIAPVEGAAVYPRLAVGAGTTFRQPLQLGAVRDAVGRALPALRESVALGGWNGPHTTLDESCCGDAAPKLALLLRAQGVPARLVEAEFHYYVILDLPDGQVVVDPTVRQFFGKKQAPRAVPHVFIGSIADLNSFFRRHASSKTTRYDPSRIYFSDAIVREDALRALAATVRAGGVADHDPLRRFLGLPPAAPRPPDSPRLIIP